MNERMLSALYAAGVDNWEWYDESLSALPENASDEDILYALEVGGVDNWIGYEYAQEIMEEWDEDSDNETEVKNEPEVYPPMLEEPEEKIESLSEAEALLLEHVGEERYDELLATIFKRSSFPAEFDESMKVLEKGNREDARVALVKNLIRKKKL